MAAQDFGDKRAARASDFLNFETPSYKNYSADSNSSYNNAADGFGSRFNSTTASTASGFPMGAVGSSSAVIGGGKSDENFLLKGIEFVANGASDLQSKTSSYFGSSTSDGIFKGSSAGKLSTLASMGKTVFNLNANWKSDAAWKTYTNYKVFLALFAASMLFGFLSLMSLPFIVFAPYKFGLLFTCASVLFLLSMAFLRGAGTLIEHLLDTTRVAFTCVYFTSLFLTLIFSTIYPLYVMALLASLVQSVSLMSVLISYIPGGAGALKVLYSSLWSYIKGAASGGSGPNLPL